MPPKICKECGVEKPYRTICCRECYAADLVDGYIILSELSQKAVNEAIKYGNIFSVDPRTDGNEFWNHKDNYRLSCRPVRLVAAPYYLNCGSPHGSSQAEV